MFETFVDGLGIAAGAFAKRLPRDVDPRDPLLGIAAPDCRIVRGNGRL